MSNNKSFSFVFIGLLILTVLNACSSNIPPKKIAKQSEEEEQVINARRVAIDAYIYAYPMLEYYKSMYRQNIDVKSPQYKAPFNQPSYVTQLPNPKAKHLPRYNNDNLYTLTRYDLRTEPLIWSVPNMGDRYFVIQFVDMFTHNFAYVGTRSTGNNGGNYMLVGPNWHGQVPDGMTKIIRSETNFPYSIQRTSVLPEEVEQVSALIKSFKLIPFHQFIGKPSPKPAPEISFPVYKSQKAESMDFIGYFNFLLEQVSLPSSEQKLFDQFASIGISPGSQFDSSSYSRADKIMIKAGIAKAMNDIKTRTRNLVTVKNGWQIFAGIYGSRDKLQGDYLTRAAAARFGLYGNDEEEVYYPATTVDSKGYSLNASETSYVLHFDKEDLPPVNGFWTLSLYKMPDHSLVENPINRYAINSQSKDLHFAEDGSLTLYIQHKSPGKIKESNWLPAPQGKFLLQFRAYMPKPEAIQPDNLWVPPKVVVAN